MSEKEKLNSKSILEMAHGAIMERADYEMNKVVENILDINTKAAKKRTLTVTLEFLPDDDRQQIQVKATSKSKLEPTNAVSTALYITGDLGSGEAQAVEMVPQIPGQQTIDGSEQEEAPVLKLIKNA
jgi:hypothetical protein